jgi:signal peptidase
MTRTARRLGVIALWLLLAAVAALVALLVVVPRLLGWVPLTILTGSMDPTYAPGSQVVVEHVEGREAAERVQLGDVVTFMPYPDDPTLVTHRVVGRTMVGNDVVLTTQGDANPSVDPEPITGEQVRGLVRYHVPYAGYLAQVLDGQQKGTGVMLAVAALGAYALVQLVGAARVQARPTSRRAAA